MPIYIPTIIKELRENTTEEQRKGLSILESRFYECIELKKENSELVQKIHILTESQMNLENALGSQADYFKQQIGVLESKLFAYSELLKRCKEYVENVEVEDSSQEMKDALMLLIDIERMLND